MSLGTVLVLEDSRVQAQFISKMLTSLGWSAVMAFDHKGVFSLLQSSRVDLMLLDVYVEEGNTLLQLPAIRELAPDIPVAIMSAGGMGGHALNSTLNMARKAQADFVLPKPFGPADLGAILDEAFQMRRASAPPKHVLVVDDCRIVRTISTRALAEKNYRISEARSMEEAFERIDIAHVDVVITDIFMPGMGGIEGISIIKGTWPNVAVIAMSAGSEKRLDTNQALAAAKHIGADALLPKPFSADDLTFLVEAVMSERAVAA